jgi:hypothetical protein
MEYVATSDFMFSSPIVIAGLDLAIHADFQLSQI